MTEKPILIVDDDPRVCEILELYLQKEGYAVLTAGDGKEALAAVKENDLTLMILDIMLPEIDGWEVCRLLRSRGNMLPVIMLSAKTEDYDKTFGLDLGADDYVEKPFNPQEVVSRVKAVLRRSRPADTQTTLSFPGLEIDPESYEVRLDGSKVEMTPREVEILSCLAENPGQVYTRERLLEKVWGYDYMGDTRTVDVHIKHIRDKLKTESKHPWEIATVWGVGYKFVVGGKDGRNVQNSGR